MTTQQMDSYKHVKPWTMPANYAGEVWPDYYSAGIGQSRDSDSLERANFSEMLSRLGGESETVIVVRESHWAVGWVEWIAIHATDEAALAIADRALAALADYPCLNEDAWSEMEWNEAADYWDSLSPRDKVEFAMSERDRCHWLSEKPVWRFGRYDFSTAVEDPDIGQAIYDHLRG